MQAELSLLPLLPKGGEGRGEEVVYSFLIGSKVEATSQTSSTKRSWCPVLTSWPELHCWVFSSISYQVFPGTGLSHETSNPRNCQPSQLWSAKAKAENYCENI